MKKFAEIYQEIEEEIEDYFEFEPSVEPGCQGSVMLKPAFVKNKNIILKGLVREPNT